MFIRQTEKAAHRSLPPPPALPPTVWMEGGLKTGSPSLVLGEGLGVGAGRAVLVFPFGVYSFLEYVPCSVGNENLIRFPTLTRG